MGNKKKDWFMDEALKQAQRAFKKNEVPVGAIVVDEQGVIVGRGYNRVESDACQASHAEVIALRKACKKKESWRLNGCWIYVTLEPCLMCLGLIRLSRLDGVVCAAQSTEYGGISQQKAGGALFAKELVIEFGVRKEQSLSLLRSFFKHIRKLRKAQSERKT